MPTIKSSRKNFQKSKAQLEADAGLKTKMTKSAHRRPGREVPAADEAEVPVVDVESGEVSDEVQEPAFEKNQQQSEAAFEAEEPTTEKVGISFFGSELLRSRFPQPFELAETVATNWVQGGEFKDLPIEHPLGNYVAQKGLLKAKELEKKVLESPVTEKVAMQVLTTGLKAQSLIEQIRQKLKK